MGIEKMRPYDLHSKILLMRERDGAEYFLKNNRRFIDVACPSCGFENKAIHFFKYGFSHKKCTSCKTLYVSPRPTQAMLFDYYENYDAPRAWNDILVQTNDERKYLQHNPRVQKLRDVLASSDNVKDTFVDLGAGNGNFAKAVLEANIFKNVIASDISTSCIESCKSQGLYTKQCSIEDFDDKSIDCITFNDLIEHVFNPHDFLMECHKKLSDNGILMLSTPNGEGFDFKILGDKTENITPPEHIQYFNPGSMEILLKKVGFEVLDVSTPGILDVEIIKRQYKEKCLNLKNNEFIEFLLRIEDEDSERNFQSFLQKSNLSSHMLIFAKKI